MTDATDAIDEQPAATTVSPQRTTHYVKRFRDARREYLIELGTAYRWHVVSMAVVAELEEGTIRRWCREFRIDPVRERRKAGGG